MGQLTNRIRTNNASEKVKVCQVLIGSNKERCKKVGKNAEDIKTFLYHFKLVFHLKDGDLFIVKLSPVAV